MNICAIPAVSQSLEQAWYHTGWFDCATINIPAMGEAIFAPDAHDLQLSSNRVVDFDIPGVWARAEAIFKLLPK